MRHGGTLCAGERHPDPIRQTSGTTLVAVREKPIVMPVLIGDEQKSVARKIRMPVPSMPAGTIVWVDVNARWLRARVERIQFAVLHLTIAA